MNQPRALNREAARTYLNEVWGFELSKTYLADAAWGGDGPPYSIIAKRAYYLVAELDAWARQKFGLETAAE